MKLFERTKQQIFDEALAHARKQGRRCVDKEENCAYRSPEGLKCFIGALISDEDYDPKLEGKSVRYLPEISVGVQDKEKLYLAEKLQNLHDNISPENWENGFEDIAQEESVLYTPPQ